MVKRRIARASLAIRLGLLFCGISWIPGCGSGDSETAWQSAKVDQSADEVIESIRSAYAKTTHYADEGVLLLAYELEGAPQQERHPFSVAFDRDLGDDFRLFHARLNRQGNEQSVAVFDPKTNNVDQQVLVRENVEFSSSLDLPPDPILQHFSNGRADLPLTPKSDVSPWLRPPAFVLAANLEDQPWFLGKRTLLEPASLDGQEYLRVRVDTKAGRVVIWVDSTTNLIRRIELPESILDRKMLEKANVQNYRFIADFKGASFAEANAHQRVSWSPGRESTRVRQFVSLPSPFPSETIGRRARDFQVQLEDGRPLESSALRGQTTAWIWFSSDPICREPLRQFEEVAKRNGKARFLAVSTDLPSVMSNSKLKELSKSWGLSATDVVRDWKQVGKTVFGIELLPTLVILDGTGKVQYFKVIEDGQVAANLSAVLARLEKGDDIATEMRREYADYVKHYKAQLASAAVSSTGTGLQTTPASLKTERMPRQFRLTPKWELKELAEPGNIGVIQRKSSAVLSVFDGYQTLVEITADGQIARRHKLGSTSDDTFTQVRGTPVGSNHRWAVGSVLGRRLKHIDASGQVTLLGLNGEEAIRDFQWTRNADGFVPDLMIGYWEGRGVERVNERGEIIAKLDGYENIACLAITPPSRSGSSKLLGTLREGGMLRAELTLQAAERSSLDGLEIAHVFTAGQGKSGEAMLCVLGLDDQGQVQAWGLDEQWRVCWKRPLSTDVFERQVQFVQSGPMSDTTLWAIARPDGNVHLISADGTLNDDMHLGTPIHGLAVVKQGNETLLLAATKNGVKCWSVAPNVEQAARNEANRR